MPVGMNGIALARAAQDLVPGIRVLLTTGYAGDVDAPTADGSSEFELIYKPYQHDDLARKVRLILDSLAESRD